MRDPEIGDLHLAVIGDQQVAGFDVAVHQARQVRGIEIISREWFAKPYAALGISQHFVSVRHVRVRAGGIARVEPVHHRIATSGLAQALVRSRCLQLLRQVAGALRVVDVKRPDAAHRSSRANQRAFLEQLEIPVRDLPGVHRLVRQGVVKRLDRDILICRVAERSTRPAEPGGSPRYSIPTRVDPSSWPVRVRHLLAAGELISS